MESFEFYQRKGDTKKRKRCHKDAEDFRCYGLDAVEAQTWKSVIVQFITTILGRSIRRKVSKIEYQQQLVMAAKDLLEVSSYQHFNVKKNNMSSSFLVRKKRLHSDKVSFTSSIRANSMTMLSAAGQYRRRKQNVSRCWPRIASLKEVIVYLEKRRHGWMECIEDFVMCLRKDATTRADLAAIPSGKFNILTLESNPLRESNKFLGQCIYTTFRSDGFVENFIGNNLEYLEATADLYDQQWFGTHLMGFAEAGGEFKANGMPWTNLFLRDDTASLPIIFVRGADEVSCTRSFCCPQTSHIRQNSREKNLSRQEALEEYLKNYTDFCQLDIQFDPPQIHGAILDVARFSVTTEILYAGEHQTEVQESAHSLCGDNLKKNSIGIDDDITKVDTHSSIFVHCGHVFIIRHLMCCNIQHLKWIPLNAVEKQGRRSCDKSKNKSPHTVYEEEYCRKKPGIPAEKTIPTQSSCAAQSIWFPKFGVTDLADSPTLQAPTSPRFSGNAECKRIVTLPWKELDYVSLLCQIEYLHLVATYRPSTFSLAGGLLRTTCLEKKDLFAFLHHQVFHSCVDVQSRKKLHETPAQLVPGSILVRINVRLNDRAVACSSSKYFLFQRRGPMSKNLWISPIVYIEAPKERDTLSAKWRPIAAAPVLEALFSSAAPQGELFSQYFDCSSAISAVKSQPPVPRILRIHCSVSMIKRAGVFPISCNVCKARVYGRLGSRCTKHECHGIGILRANWQVLCVIEDGSGDADLHLEGSVAEMFLNLPSSLRQLCISEANQSMSEFTLDAPFKNMTHKRKGHAHVPVIDNNKMTMFNYIYHRHFDVYCCLKSISTPRKADFTISIETGFVTLGELSKLADTSFASNASSDDRQPQQRDILYYNDPRVALVKEKQNSGNLTTDIFGSRFTRTWMRSLPLRNVASEGIFTAALPRLELQAISIAKIDFQIEIQNLLEDRDCSSYL